MSDPFVPSIPSVKTSSGGEGIRALQTMAEAVQLLITQPNVFPAIEQALRVIGESSMQDRAYFFDLRQEGEAGTWLSSQRCEWTAPGISTQLNNPDLQNVPMESQVPRLLHFMQSNIIYEGPVRTFPPDEQAMLLPQGIVSMLITAVYGNRGLRGFIGFDNCRIDYPWTAVEHSMLRGTAAAIGAALDRHETSELLRESEERFHHMLENIPSVSVQGYLADGTVVFWNSASEKVYGYTREEAMGRNLYELIIPEEMQAEVRSAVKAAMEGTPIPGAELKLRRKDGTFVPVYSSHSLVRRPGRPSELFCLDVDLSEYKALENQLLRSQRMEAIGTLAGGIGHDLNNVLSPVLMSLGMLKDNEEDEQRLAMLGMMEKSILRGSDMIRQLLSFARGMEGQKIQVNLLFLLGDLKRILTETFPKNIHLTFHLEPDLACISGDPTQVHQVLLNLCVNARDAMENGGTLRVAAGMTDLRIPPPATLGAPARSGRYVLIVVSDSGSGIRAEDALRIFEPFFSTKPRGKGTGLGLSTSLAILKSHGGFIHFSSKPGQGSTFCVYLPVATDAPQRKDGSAVAPVPRGEGQLILVVDDEESIREITRKTLEASGYKVLLAANGQEALDLFRPQCGQIALVVTDLMMPVMDGIQLMSELRKQYPKTRILATSGLSSQTSLSEQVPGLADRFVAKPYSSPDFLREVHALLR